MVKIFGFIGSPLKENSNTYTLTKMMLDKLIEMDKNIKYELLTAGHVKINHCKGCWSCMKMEKCLLDEIDDMKSIKQKMIDADFIIWGSPVYAMQVSGQMKTFLDRLANWYHIMNLAGKAGMTVVTTAGSGLQEIKNYLEMMLCAAGVNVITDLGAYGTFPKVLANPEEAGKEAQKTAEEIYLYLTGKKHVETSEDLEQYFQTRKYVVKKCAKWLPDHYKYWKEKGMLELNSFADLLENL